MPVDKGGDGGEQRQPNDWERIDTEQAARDAIQRKYDQTHDMSEVWEKSARKLPEGYGADRPASRTVNEDQLAEMVEFLGQKAVDKQLESGRLVLDVGNEAGDSDAAAANATEGADSAGDGEPEGDVVAHGSESDEAGKGDFGIADTKADLDAAYATGDQEKIAVALRDALAKVEGRTEPERQTTWETIAEEMGGEVKSFPNYEAAKRALGVVPGTEIHHIVEQAQAKPERTGWDLSRINSTDNLTRIPPEVHREISKHYSRNVPGLGQPLRDVLNGTSWEYQTDVGREALDKQMKEYRDGR